MSQAAIPCNSFSEAVQNKSIVVKSEDERTQTYLYLPDTMAAWPWPRKFNPFYEDVATESNLWFKSFSPLTPESQYGFDKCNFGRLAALIYPDASRGWCPPAALVDCIMLMSYLF